MPYFAEAWAFGGIPRVAAGLTRALARRGHEVTVVTTDVCDRASRLASSAPGLNRDARFRRGADGLDVRVFRNWSNWLAYDRQLFLPSGLRSFLARNAARFEVAHLHAYRNLPVAFAASALTAAGVPFVLTPNGSVPRIESRRWAKAIWDFLVGRAPLDRAARVLAVTEFERRELVGWRCAAERVELLPNPLDLGELDPAPERGRFRRRLGLIDERIVLYLGRISPRKRLDLLARAVAALPGDDVRLVIAGTEMGGGQTALEAVRAAGVERRTRFVGLLTGRERLEALADADAVAYATEGEIFGLVPLEAILCGSPVVVADDSGCGELIHSTGGGLVVAAGDAGELARALADLLERPVVWRREVAAAAEIVRARFGADQVAARLESIYRAVIAEHAGVPGRGGEAQPAAASGASIS